MIFFYKKANIFFEALKDEKKNHYLRKFYKIILTSEGKNFQQDYILEKNAKKCPNVKSITLAYFYVKLRLVP